MQSFIVNIPEEKVAFFAELMQQLNVEIFAIDEPQPTATTHFIEEDTAEEDPFLDWEAELRSAKKKK